MTTLPSSAYAEGEIIPGTVYRVVKRLGDAGLGAVYEVADENVRRHFCLKTLASVAGDIEEFRRRLAIEAQTLARLAHPNIVQVITAGVTEDRRMPYFVMELLRGRTLRETLESKGALEVAHVFDIATQILDALDHAHGRGVVHRDVKPENIFLHRDQPDGLVQAKLLDFGVVAFLRDVPGVAEPPGFSPRYAAPEIVEGKPATPSSDLYSMGLVLYEMLCGYGPFDRAGDLADVARARLEGPPAPLGVQVPIVLEDLVLCALERDPALRPEDAFSFAETLRVLSGKISRLPQQSLLSSAPPPALPSISEIPAALVQADWRPPATPRASEVREALGSSSDALAHTAEKNADSPPTLRRPQRPTSSQAPDTHRSGGATRRSSVPVPGATRDTLMGVALGLVVLLVTFAIVMLK